MHFLEDSRECDKCGKILDRACLHAFCCAPAESTIGHYRVCDAILPLVHLADTSACAEVLGLIPSAPALCPADIFSATAVPGCRAALDIGIMSPDATGAGTDCCRAIFEKKCKDYSKYRQELADDQVEYIPLAFSSYGRIHPTSLAILENIARRAALRHGYRDHQVLLRRTLKNVSVAIWERAAAMRAC